MSPPRIEWLLVIDMQRAFADATLTDACAGGSREAHDHTMVILAGFAPLVGPASLSLPVFGRSCSRPEPTLPSRTR